MVYLAELLVVMTDRLKIIRIHARNVPRVHGHKRLDDDALLASLLPQESDGVVFWIRSGAFLLKHKKNSSWDNLCISCSGLYARMLSRQYALFTLTPNLSSLTVINPVLAKSLENPHLTR